MNKNYELTKLIGVCWHEAAEQSGIENRYYDGKCMHCGAYEGWKNRDFYTWEGFGQLWGWVMLQDWFPNFYTTYFIDIISGANHTIYFVEPTKFADAVLEFLTKMAVNSIDERDR